MELKPCPFCGGAADIIQHGDSRMSTIYRCEDCSAYLETGEKWDHGRRWNTRPREQALEAQVASLTAALNKAKGFLRAATIKHKSHGAMLAQIEKMEAGHEAE